MSPYNWVIHPLTQPQVANQQKNLNLKNLKNLCRKLPPKTMESWGVYTAWIQPEGMKNVFPASISTRQQFSTLSPKKISL